MPAGKFYKYKSKRKGKKKKTYKQSFNVTNKPISRVPSTYPLPKIYKCTFRYNELKYLALPSGGGLLSFIFTANGLYDADVGGGGHYPSGFLAMMGMYDHYCVIHCKITCTFVNTSSAALICGIDTKDNLTVSTDYREMIESGNCTYSMLSPFGCGNNQITLTRKINVGKFLGVSKILSSDKCQGKVGQNPSEEIGLFPFVYTGNTSVQAARIPVNIALEYTTVLHEPSPVGIS